MLTSGINDGTQKNFAEVENEIARLQDEIYRIEESIDQRELRMFKEQECKFFEIEHSESHCERSQKLQTEFWRYANNRREEVKELWNKIQILKGLAC